MKIHFFLFVVFLLLAAATAQQQPMGPNGMIYGVVLDQNGEAAKGIHLTAEPLGVGLAAMLPTTTTNEAGEYRFERLPWWGRYTVYADDEKPDTPASVPDLPATIILLKLKSHPKTLRHN